LDAQGNSNAIFIFQIDGALSTAALSSVSLINSASICNVFWQINGAVSLKENSTFIGTMLVQGAISLLQGATLNGRGLSTAGAISLAENLVTIPTGSAPPPSIITASGPTSICLGDSVVLSGNTGGLWNNGSSSDSIIVEIPGNYYVINANGCGRDTSNQIIVKTILDDTPPNITCPVNITVDLNPLECEGIANFPDATASDNCPGVTVMRTSPIASGENFPIGVNVVVYQATDASNNTSTCSFTVTVREYQAPSLGCITVQLSLDDDCEGELTPTMVLTGWQGPMGEVLLGCLDLYTINVIGSNGQNLGNTVDFNQLGKVLTYSISHETNGFSCWNTVHVEDKIAPTITCRDITVNCLTDLTNVGLPVVDDNCHANRVLVNEVHHALLCDTNYIGTVTRTWKAVDGAGNESAPCTQTIYLERSDLSGITFPKNIKLACNSGYATDNKGFGYPNPSVTGIPYNGANPLYPTSQLNMVFCNAVIDYTDFLLIDTKCKKRIMRTWAITEWWCSSAIVYNMPPQFIDIVDELAPVIPPVANYIVTTQTRSCDALVQLPELNITDNCTAVYRVFVNITRDGNPVGFIDSNGGPATLGVGVNIVTYTALDECGNTSTGSHEITVRDKTDPVAICDQFTTVSLKTNGFTEVTAKGIDDGSFDECGAVTLKVRRMEDPCSFGHDTAWYDKVGFCCLDANLTRMVQLLVTDAGGNTNICMVSVNVQEKVNPSIACPADLTINDCLYTFDPANADAYFGKAVITDNCPANNNLVQTLKDNRNNCGTGKVVRTFLVTQGGITYDSCTQTITFNNIDPFDGNDTLQLKWPKNYTALGQCSFEGLLPETLPDSSSTPKILEDACDLVGMKYTDEVYPFTTNGACYKIIRTWSVIDWCQKNTDLTPKIWTYQQEIKVRDTTKPVITSVDTMIIVCTYDSLCLSGQITLTASATDCTPANELKWKYYVTKGGINFSNGVGNNASGKYPIGIYNIRFTVEDKCGNLSETSYGFEIRNCKAPIAIAKKGLAASLVLMDVGSGPVPMTMLRPSFFDNKSGHICGYPVKLSFSSNVNDTVKVYGCANIGINTIHLWVTDINGNYSYVETFVDIQDSMGLCPIPNPIVDGRTIMENQEEIQNVTVEMRGGEMNPVNTDIHGKYGFTFDHVGGNYQVVPGKDGDDLNGISTLDIIMIQRHILGIEKLNSPYKLIAADINNSGKVSASDLTELRKLILGVYTEFPDNTSWRFVDAAYVFPDVTNPWVGQFQEKYFINNLSNDMNIDFVGVKIGDVNGNAKSKDLNNKPLESRNKSFFTVDEKQVLRGDIIEIPVFANNEGTIFGLQARLESKDLKFRDIKEGLLNVRPEDFNIDSRGNITMSLTKSNGQNLQDGSILFTIEVEALNSGLISQMIKINKDFSPEVYMNNDLETKTFGLDWRTSSAASFTLLSNSPNPWNSQTSIYFEMPKQGMVSLKLRDYSGRKVLSRVDQFSAGKNSIQLNREDLGQAGVYIYELRYGDKLVTGKMILVD
jgi:hypothetical protein